MTDAVRRARRRSPFYISSASPLAYPLQLGARTYVFRPGCSEPRGVSAAA